MRNPEKSRSVNSKWKKENAAVHCALNAKRKAAQLRRTPVWADMDAIKAFYVEAALLTETTGIEYHVDHVVPMQGELVSGLHVHNNLQILTAKDNMSKGNRWKPIQTVSKQENLEAS